MKPRKTNFAHPLLFVHHSCKPSCADNHRYQEIEKRIRRGRTQALWSQKYWNKGAMKREVRKGRGFNWGGAGNTDGRGYKQHF